MSAIRVVALGIGWIVMLAGSLACIGAAALAVAVTAGVGFAPGWSMTGLVAAGGFALMLSALPLMFFGCEARHDIRMNRAIPCDALARVTIAAHAVPAMPDMPALAMAGAGAGSHLSSFAVRTLDHRR